MNKLFFFITVSVLSINCLAVCSARIVHNLTTDQEALVAFKTRIISDPNNILVNNWSTNTSICNWIGVSCSRKWQRVTALDFSNFGFSGTIAPHLGNLSFLGYLNINSNNFTGIMPLELSHLRRLKEIDMGSNNFTGVVPSWLGTIPELRHILLDNNRFSGSIPTLLLHNNSKLETLQLDYNFLNGNIPQEICNLFALEYLYLRSNMLTGSIPFGIFNMSSLRELGLRNNGLSGEIPSNIYNCRYLEVLSLSINHFNGSIPSAIGNLNMLQDLRLGYNNFIGRIPPEIGNLSNLEILSIPRFSQTGPIPSFVFNMSTLKVIQFGYNNLYGSLPVDIYLKLPELVELYLYSNQFTGGIPATFGNLTRLQILYLYGNNLAGELPAELGNLNLVEFSVHSNGLSGSIPFSMFNISTLEIMDMGDNYFSGYLPSMMGFSLPDLDAFYLGGNRLSGVIPSSITNASKLTKLDISSNFLTGTIPNFGSLRLLQIFSIGGNNLIGESSRFFSSLTNCRYLKNLEAFETKLIGVLPASIGNLSASLKSFFAYGCNIKSAIPIEIGNLSSLEYLLLDRNQLTGFIPSTIGKLKRLQRKDISMNKLEGYIPLELCQLSNLGDMDLSDNLLNGSIPDCLGELKSLRNVHLGSNKLESTVPFKLWNLNDLLRLNLSHNSLSGNLPFEIGNLNIIFDIDFSWNQFSGNIPSSIGKIQSLVSLSFAHNRFQGSIPQSLGIIINLESLNLSFNNFSGSIPKSLEELRHLEHLDVSHNRLQGEIPTGGRFANFTAQSFIQNYALCSETRKQFPPCGKARKRSRSKNVVSLMKYILPPIISVILGVTILLIVRRRKSNEYVPQSEISLHLGWRRISYRELEEATNAFGESNILGSGSFGSVYGGILSDGLNVAVKVFNLQSEQVRAIKSFATESQVLSTIRRRNLIRIIGCCSNTDFKALILEYMPNGSLEKWLYSHNYFLDMLKRLNIAIDVALALEYLHHGHTFPIVHCDLKPSNVLLNEDMVAHVSDFGIAKLFDEGESTTHTKTLATIGYMAPEYGTEGIVPTSGDVYSYGVMLLEMYTRKKPTDKKFREEMSLKSWVSHSLDENTITEVVDTNLLGREEENFAKKDQCVSSILALAIECLTDSPTERINMREVVFDVSHNILEEEILVGGRFASFTAKYFEGTLSDGLNVALKVFNFPSERVTKSFDIETEILSTIHHRNLVRIIGCCSNKEFKALTLEYMPNGSLEIWLYSHNYFLDMLKRLDIAIDVALALEYLHHGLTFTVLHCDLKPRNVLLDQYMVGHVGDFGIAKLFGQGESIAQTKTLATIGYMVPEYGSEGIVSTSGDVYRFGIMLLEMYTRKKPTDAMFGEKMRLKGWVIQSLDENKIIEVVDANLLRREDTNFSA
ncbi:LRR receptor-like serine/threonine-protein kinase FLS2 [Abeliophyllum distichum]|uniref:non-specific serine/threonine protein kinase n=1 Tax=Abeliophyllum distichum TaxID=126358 RepID=A0ABD1TL20_9LAMI